jgi:hypothetical protein
MNKAPSTSPSSEEWVTLYFPGADYRADMGRFVDDLDRKYGESLKTRIRVGINGINVVAPFFEEIKIEFDDETYNYINDGVL